MGTKLDLTLLYNVARMYYQDNLGQQEISRMVGISRPQISRLLKEARECGIVQINVNKPFDVDESYLAQQLIDLLGISNAQIIKAETAAPEDIKKRFYNLTDYAADYLSERILSGKNIGIGWGETIYRVVLKMPIRSQRQYLCFVPLVGNTGLSQPAFQSNSIVDRIAEKYKAQAYFMSTPAFITDIDIFEALMGNAKTTIESKWADLDMAIFGIGTALHDSPALINAIGDSKIIEAYENDQTVGDILGNYFDENGEIHEMPNVVVASIPVSTLLKIPARICVATGEKKVKGLLAAGKKGLYNELITDNITAMGIVKEYYSSLANA